MVKLYWWENYSPETTDTTDSESNPQPNNNVNLTTKTLNEIAQENKLKGKIAFDFQDVQDIIDGKKDNELM